MMRARCFTWIVRLAMASSVGCGASGTSTVASGPTASPAPVVVDVAPVPAAVPSAMPTAEPELTPRQSTEGPSPRGAIRRDPDGLVVEDLVVGRGALLTRDHEATVHYDGTLTDGRRFDSSRERGRPFEFLLGAGHVIAGWERGLEGMRIGGVRRLEIPPDLAYGPRGRPPMIPPGATLVFEIELLAIQ